MSKETNEELFERMSKRSVYLLRVTEDAPPLEIDSNMITPCIAVEGEAGYHKTDWKWEIHEDMTIDDMQSIVDNKNEALGFDKEETDKIIFSTLKL